MSHRLRRIIRNNVPYVAERSGVKVFRTTHLHNVAVECQMTVERDDKEFHLVRQCYSRTNNINVGSIGNGFGELVGAEENGISFFRIQGQTIMREPEV